MNETFKGWVIINIGHPNNGEKYIVNFSFAYTKNGCIKEFINGSGHTWEYWRRKYNFRCVRAIMTIKVD